MGNSKATRTEQIWLKGDPILAELCHLSKNLYNEANYIVRQELFKTGKWTRCSALDKILNGKGTEQSENYKQLSSGTAQQILRLLDKSWKSFFKAIRVWKAHPEKFLTKPKIPGYKKKDGEHILVFTNRQCKIKNNVIRFPKKVGLELKTRLPEDTNLREARIIPRGVGYVLEIVYEKVLGKIGKRRENNSKRIVGIDLGSANIVTMTNNIGLKPIAVKDDGRGIKSINQFYNKRKAELQSVYDKQGIKDGAKLRGLRAKRERKAKDYVHKLSRFIVDWCVQHEIETIVFGYNEGWKQKVNIGRRNNQTFTQIPFMEIINKTIYKAEEKGIEVNKQEESHTSKCSFLDNEPVEHREEYVGRRISRSLFKTAKGTIIHADVNAAYNIIVKKASPKAFSNECEWIGGCALHPVCSYITHKGKLSNV